MINIAILGFGNIGGGLAEVISRNYDRISAEIGDEIKIKYVLDKRDLSQTEYANAAISDFDVILSDPEVSVVCEMMGGTQPAFDYSLAALKAKKSVVTSNKEVVARFGTQLTEAALENGVSYLYEAAVGGVIPIIHALDKYLPSTEITRIDGILNGTTNYILTRMHDCSLSFEEALGEAKMLGYAEPNPTADISGADPCRKIAILAALAWGGLIPTENIHCVGISDISAEDNEFAAICGGVLKLVATAIKTNNGVALAVTPSVVLSENPLSSASGVYNSVKVSAGDMGDIMLHGMGAGRYPTASAIVTDIIDAVTFGGGRHGKTRALLPYTGEECTFSDVEYDWCVLVEASSDELKEKLPNICVLSENDGVSAILCEKISENSLKAELSEFSVKKLIRALI